MQANPAKHKLSGYICRVHMKWPDPWVSWPFPPCYHTLGLKRKSKWYFQVSVTLFCVPTYFVVEDLEYIQGYEEKEVHKVTPTKLQWGHFFSTLLILVLVF